MLNAINHPADAASAINPMLKTVTIAGDVYGGTFEAKVTQHFTNPSSASVEVIYTFPMPPDATLLRVDVQMEGKRLSGKIVAKAEANVTYEETLSEGDAAILLERAHDGNYVLSLGNLAPGENCSVEISYAHMLAFEQDSLRIRIPTVIAPRYGDPHSSGRLLPHQVPTTDLLAEYEFALELRLHGQLAKSRVASPSHPISIDPTGHASSHITTVTLGSRSLLDRDFVLVIDQLQSNSLVTLSPDMNQSENYALIANFSPSVKQATELPVAVKILVDCSGSMKGDSIQATKNALHVVLSAFEENDKFSLSRFGSTIEHRSRALWSVKKRTITSAAQWVDDLQADMGGTNIGEALDSTCRLAGSKNQLCDILLITDGSIYAIDEVLETAKSSNQRVFIVAIGSSPEGNFLTQLSQATGGACEFVASAERAESAISRMFSRIRATKISDLSLSWPEPVKPVWVSNIVTSVFSGDTTHIYAWVKKAEIDQVRGKELRLFGKLGEDGQQTELARATLGIDEQTDAPNTNFAISKFVAIECIAQSCDKSQKDSLALDYQLVTESTSLVIINHRSEADKATEMPALHVVQQMMPAGHSGFGSIQHSTSDLDSGVAYDLNVPSVLRNPKSRHQSTYSSTNHSIDIPSFLRREVSIDRTIRRTKVEDLVTVIEVIEPIYWFRTIDPTGYHYAVIEEDTFSGSFLIRFFTVKRKNWSWREEAVVFDNLEFPDEDSARTYLVLNKFCELNEGTFPGARKAPKRLRLQLKNLKGIYAVDSQP
jgi:Ca-activated chloride channel family protein